MPLPPVPGEQCICETIVDKSRNWQHQRVAEQRCQPALARRRPPHRDGDIRADDQTACFVGRVRATTDVIERVAVGGQRIGLIVDVLE
jgi:hypothetical protein